MNEIEQKFYDAYIDEYVNPDNKLCCTQEIKDQVNIDIYRVDFVINGEFIIEIDGHEYHKTKDQRFLDYKRERYLQNKGYTPIRYMGSEVFIDANKCARDALRTVENLIMKRFDNYAAYEQYKRFKPSNKFNLFKKIFGLRRAL